MLARVCTPYLLDREREREREKVREREKESEKQGERKRECVRKIEYLFSKGFTSA